MRFCVRFIAAVVTSFHLISCGEVSDRSSVSAPDAAPSAGLEAVIDGAIKESNFSGVMLVADHGDVIFKKTYDPEGLNVAAAIEIDSKFAIASLTKTFSATLILILQEEGDLSLDDTIADHLPGFNAAYANDVTVRQLLQNRSGIPHYIDIDGWFDNDWKREQSRDSFLQEIASLQLTFEPGSDYLYSNSNYYILGLIAERTTGKPYETLLAESILTPLGLEDTGQLYETDIDGLTQNLLSNDSGDYDEIPIVNPALMRATASQYSTARDLLDWSNALMGDGLLSAQSKTIMLDPEAPMAWTVGAAPISGNDPVQLHTYNGRLIGYTSMLTQFPSRESTIIILSNNGTDYETLSSLTLIIASELYKNGD